MDKNTGTPGDQNQAASDDSRGKETPAIEIDGKKYGAEEVKQLVGQVGTATQNNQIAARLKEIANKYGVDPTNYLAQAEGALGVISELIDKGVINEKGEIVQSSNKSSDADKKSSDPSLDDLFGQPDEISGKKASSVEEIINKALKPQIEGLAAKMDQLAEIQAGMIREDYGRKIKNAFPNLDDEDISRVFAAYQNDRAVGLMDHAKKVSEKKEAYLNQLKKQYAEKWGVDLEKVESKNENEVKDAAKGGAGVLFKGKKFSMRESGEGVISPKAAAKEYFAKVFKES